MTLHKTIIAGVALCTLAGPAAAGDGLYVGLGVGWNDQNNIRVDQLSPPPASGVVSTNDGAIFAGTLGYKLLEFPIRLEFESGYNWHSISQFQSGGVDYAAAGHANIASELFNAIYDFPVGPGWNIYGGAGLGLGHVYFAPYLSDTGAQIAHTDHWDFMWQAIGGVSFEIAPDVDLFADYRYREAQASTITYTPYFGPVSSHSISENVVLAGIRFYILPPMVAPEYPPYPPPPPPQYYGPPPPPPSPPPPPESPSMPSGGAGSGGSNP
jgi:opacity protein-like surface antigen